MTDPDTRPRVALNKPVNLSQLAAEVGAALTASDTEVAVADPASKVTQAALEKAVAAHTPDPTFGISAEDKAVKALANKAKAGALTPAETQQALALLLSR